MELPDFDLQQLFLEQKFNPPAITRFYDPQHSLEIVVAQNQPKGKQIDVFEEAFQEMRREWSHRRGDEFFDGQTNRYYHVKLNADGYPYMALVYTADQSNKPQKLEKAIYVTKNYIYEFEYPKKDFNNQWKEFKYVVCSSVCEKCPEHLNLKKIYNRRKQEQIKQQNRQMPRTKISDESLRLPQKVIGK